MVLSDLRCIALDCQGLIKAASFGKGVSGVKSAIEHLGYVQIDSLSVVERAHHHVLWSRVPQYKPKHLNTLLANGGIFEYWFHAASFLPMSDFRYSLIRKSEVRRKGGGRSRIMREALRRIEAEGPLRMRDFGGGGGGKTDKSWSWGPVRQALDKLFMRGDIVVCERKGVEKIYDLVERRLPNDVDLRMPSIEEYVNYLLDTSIRAHGVFTVNQLLHLHTGPEIKSIAKKLIDERVDDGYLEVVKGNSNTNFYVVADYLGGISKVTNRVRILSPFDNLVIHRGRLDQLFSFKYTLECYLPKTKRKYGYFCLPIAYGSEMVGAIDCKANRESGVLSIVGIYFDEKTCGRKTFYRSLISELSRFSRFNGCSRFEFNLSGCVSPAIIKLLAEL